MGHALAGINVAVAVLVVNAVITLWKKGIKNAFGFILFLVGLSVSVFTDISAMYVVVFAIAAGILYGTLKGRKEGSKK